MDRELANFDKFDVFDPVPASQADGKYIVTTRWEKGLKLNDEGVQIMRCRFVAREFKAQSPWRTDLFAPTTSSATSRLVDFRAAKKNYPTSLRCTERVPAGGRRRRSLCLPAGRMDCQAP